MGKCMRRASAHTFSRHSSPRLRFCMSFRGRNLWKRDGRQHKVKRKKENRKYYSLQKQIRPLRKKWDISMKQQGCQQMHRPSTKKEREQQVYCAGLTTRKREKKSQQEESDSPVKTTHCTSWAPFCGCTSTCAVHHSRLLRSLFLLCSTPVARCLKYGTVVHCLSWFAAKYCLSLVKRKVFTCFAVTTSSRCTTFPTSELPFPSAQLLDKLCFLIFNGKT